MKIHVDTANLYLGVSKNVIFQEKNKHYQLFTFL